MVRGVIFDLDGVIVSTDTLHCQAWVETSRHWNIPFTPKDNDLLRGVSRMESVEIICRVGNRALSQEDKERFAQEKNRRYGELLESLTPADVLPDVLETLEELHLRGLALAIGSSSRNTQNILRRIGLNTAFDAVADGTMIARSKPDPEVFLLAASLLKLPPEQCLVVEDAESGIQAAKAGGFLAVAIGTARSCPLADAKISRLSELFQIV
ncbi:MAG TPA: beta-phosphoglucomutase [Firmicutes bacterium]|nr:beta-phosphoglucomutase [Bacillota bacterium]